MSFISREKNILWMSIAGWLCMVFGMLLSYRVTQPNDCSFFSRLNFPASLSASVCLIVGFVFFSMSIYGVLKLLRSDQQYSVQSLSLKYSPILLSLLAFIIVPFNTHDITFYFDAGKLLAAGENIYTTTWASEDTFYCPAVVSSAEGFMYAPLTSFLLEGFYELSQGSMIGFILLWKILQVFAFGVSGYLLYLIVKSVNGKVDRNTLYVVWCMQPLMVWEWITNGHFDILWVLCVLGAILAAMKGRWWLVGITLAIGAWLKFIPVIIAPWFLLWWWQTVTKINYKEKIVNLGMGILLGLLITYLSWAPFWEGPVIFKSIILQTKWAVSSLFSTVYYSLKGLFVQWFGGQAHWLLTRLVHGLLFVLVIYFVLPLLKEAFAVVCKKRQWTTREYILAIFITLIVYLGIWQKSFWPWYISWLLPFGIILFVCYQNKYLNKIVLFLSIAPLYFYAVWLLNHFARKTDAPTELWFSYVIVGMIWVYPMTQLIKWRKTNYSLKKIE